MVPSRRNHKASPSFKNLNSSSDRATAAARGSSKKADTKPEKALRVALWRAGYRYRKNVSWLPGRPDIVFVSLRLVVFCDGDFWHGREWQERRAKLADGHNAEYWIAKIESNIGRDAANDEKLLAAGWQILRIWESEIKLDLESATRLVIEAIEKAKQRL